VQWGSIGCYAVMGDAVLSGGCHLSQAAAPGCYSRQDAIVEYVHHDGDLAGCHGGPDCRVHKLLQTQATAGWHHCCNWKNWRWFLECQLLQQDCKLA
jgi:hypothetical protein